MQFKAISISHKLAPVSIREQLHISDNECSTFLLFLQEQTLLHEFFVLSTCNRTEIYYLSDEDLSLTLIKLLCIFKVQTLTDEIISYTEVFDSQEEASEHLFRVSMGLESSVLGDVQIVNQVKTAYVFANDLKLAGPFLHRIFHTIFHTNKRVQQETDFRTGAASVSYAAMELATELFSMIPNPKILILGLGEMGRNVVLNFDPIHHSKITVTNRTITKAQEIADSIPVSITDFQAVKNELHNYDLIISSLSVETPFITRDDVSKNNLLKTQYFIDLSVPRSIAGELDSVSGCIVYNIDEIQNKVNTALETRRKSISKVEEIISSEISLFLEWTKELKISPIIQQLRNALEEIRKDEISRYLKTATSKELEIVDNVTKSMVQKILKMPVLNLKEACRRDEQDVMIDLLKNLFNLEGEKV